MQQQPCYAYGSQIVLHNETRKNNSGLINLPNVIQKFPDLGSDKPLPKVSIAVAINLVCTLPTAQRQLIIDYCTIPLSSRTL